MATSKTPRAFTSFICQSCRHRLLPSSRRALTTTSALRANGQPSNPDGAIAGLGALSNQINNRNTTNRAQQTRSNQPYGTNFTEILAAKPDPNSLLSDAFGRSLDANLREQPHRLHVYATKHNTHITFVQPPRAAAQTASSAISSTNASSADQKKVIDVLLSLSSGNLGFRKAGRGSYDAAYQLAAFVLKQIQEKGMLRDVNKLEVVLRGFGAGREAVTKALLGSEGRNVRGRITAVVDATRLKFGGPRSPKPRRLG